MDVDAQGFPTLRPAGSVVSSRSRQFVDEILSEVAGGARDLIVDMRDVTFISKEAVMGLVEVSDHVQGEGGVLALVNLRGVVKNLISLRRSGRSLQVFASEGEARAFLKRRLQERAAATVDGGAETDVEEYYEEEDADDERPGRLGRPLERLDKIIEFLAEPAPQAPGQSSPPEPSDDKDDDEDWADTQAEAIRAAEPEPEPEPEPRPEPTEPDEELPSAEELALGTFEIIGRAREAAAALQDEVEAPVEAPAAEEGDLLTLSDDQLSALMKRKRGAEAEPAAPPPPDHPDVLADDRAEGPDEAGSRPAPQAVPAGPETVFPVFAFDELAERIHSEDPKTRWFAARGLGRLGDPRGASLLEQLLQKRREFQFIREMARISLRRLGQAPPS